MVDAWLPYGKSQVCARIPTRNFLGSIEPKEKPGVSDPQAEIERAIKSPLGSKMLDESVKPENKVAIVVDDGSGRAPSSIMVPPLLDELNRAGVKDENVVVIFACGPNRIVSPEEALVLLGNSVCSRAKVVNHDCRAPDLVHVGTTQKYGTRVLLNRLFAEANVRIITGDIGFHSYAGYSGARMSVLPGVTGEESIKHNHSLLLDPNARTGILASNPVHEDMVEAAAMAKVDFVLNVVTNTRREIVKAFFGDMDIVFSEGVKQLDETYRVKVDRRADIVVTSPGGDPSDSNLFKAYVGLDNASEIVKRGGIIIFVSELSEGHGNRDFYELMVKSPDLKAAEKEIKRNFTAGGAMAYSYMKTFQKARVILVSSMPDYYAVNVFRMKTARAVNDAVNEAMTMIGKNAKIWTLPYANYTLPEVRTLEDQGNLTSD